LVAQSHLSHGQVDSILSHYPLDLVVEELNASGRYFNEIAVRVLVNEEYLRFQNDIKVLTKNPGNSIRNQIHQIYDSFLLHTKSKISIVPKIKDPNPPEPTVKVLNGPCVNMDFEQGNFNGWTLQRGKRNATSLYDFSNPVATAANVQHFMFNNGVDPIVGIPRVNPASGNFSVRLGDGTTTGANAARMSQTFLVDATNMYFTYSYAVVFESPDDHTANQRPYFRVQVLDQNGNNIACGDYAVYADAANASEYQSVISGGETVLYKNWTSVFTNLSAYIGQNVTVRFTTGDCSLSGHYGYAYIDASCAFQEIIASPDIICPGGSTSITAPGGGWNLPVEYWCSDTNHKRGCPR
jgi:hypothetical protein